MNAFQLTPELSEICGIHAGDGHLRKNKKEFELSGGFEEKEYYDQRVIPLFNKVFDTGLKGRFFYSKKTYGFSTSNKIIRNTLADLGFPYGKKGLIVSVPTRILNTDDRKIKRAFLRGIFDTDGCITFDKRIYNKDIFKKNRNYYPRIIFTTISEQLAKGIKRLSQQEGFNCKIYVYKSKKETEHLKYKPQIVGTRALIEWINKVSPRNTAKLSRVRVWEKFGFCPPNTTYEERLRILNGKADPHSFL